MSALMIRRSDGSQMRLDNTRIETFVPALSVTSHPVEGGGEVSDHVQRLPMRITLSGYMTESPYDTPSAAELGAGTDRLLRFLEWMRASEGELLDITSVRLGVFTSFVIERYPHRISSMRNLPIDIAFREIVVAESGLVVIPPLQPPAAQQVGFPDAQDAGTQATEESSDAADQSTAFSLLQSLGVVE